MTIAMELPQNARSALVFDLIRPFTEHDDARLRGNAVVALTALVDGGAPDLKDAALEELVQVLCAEHGGRDLDWRRFMAICIDAIGMLKPADRESIRVKVLRNLAGSDEPAQKATIARLVLAACDEGRRLWPASWAQFRRYATLAGRFTFWQFAWAVAWRAAIAFFAVWVAATLMEAATDGSISEGVAGQSFALWIASTIAFTIVVKLSIPGRVRPPSNVYALDTVLVTIPFGLLMVAGALIVSAAPTSAENWSAIVAIVVFGMVVGALVRWMRWINARSAIEPDGAGNVVRPASAMGLSAWACILLAHAGVPVEIAATAFLVIVPTSSLMAALDAWLEDKGPRTQLPRDPRTERRWLLPAVAGVSVVAAVAFLTMNLQSAQVVEGPASKAVVVAPQADKAPAVDIPLAVGSQVSLRVDKDGLFSIKAVSDQSGLEVWPSVRDASDSPVHSQYDETIVLKQGEYKVCATTESYSYFCRGVHPVSLIDHVVLAFGLFDTSASATLSLTYIREPNEKDQN